MNDTTARALPIGDVAPHANGRLGVWGLIATEAALFGTLLFSYFYGAFRVDRPWPTEGMPHFTLSGPNTAILVLSSVTLWWGERGLKRNGSKGQLLAGLLATFALGAIFLVIQIKEWAAKPFVFNDHTYASHFFTITGFHMAHVALGMLLVGCAALWTWLGYFDRRRHETLTMVSMYWHFVDAVWISVFCSLYVSPYLLR